MNNKMYGLLVSLGRWLRDRFLHHRIRIVVGSILLAVELYLLLGTGILLEDKVNYHTGEGSWEETLSQENPGFCQEFVPEHRHLHAISFLMEKASVADSDGAVTVAIVDRNNRILYDRTLGYGEIADGYFTDVEVDLKLIPGRCYYLSLTANSSGGYPTVGICDKSYYLPENKTLIHGDEMPDVQLVSRYSYRDTLSASRRRDIILICLLTALGTMFGLPENRYLRRVVAILMLAAGPYVLGSRLEMLTYSEKFYLPMALKWNIGIMYALEFFVLLCTHSPKFTIVFNNIALTLLYSANYFVVKYRGAPLRMNDFTALGTAAKVMGDYSYIPDGQLALAWAWLFLFILYGVQTGTGRRGGEERRGRKVWVKTIVSYAVTISIAIGGACYGGYQLIYTDLLNRTGFADEEFHGFSHDLIYYFDGYLVATCVEARSARIVPPEGYSVEYLEEVFAKAAKEGQGTGQELSGEELAQLPHIILVMNESFSDLRVAGSLELSQENLAFFHSLQKNTVRGYVNASVIGGGTANSEFEVFTGCNTAFFSSNYYPYQQGVKKSVNSLVSQMQKYGYTTYSMHPASANNWNRKSVYRYYGFDKSFWEKDFKGAQSIHFGVSDEETYHKVIELYENRGEGEKMFLFDLTIQNHGGYGGNESSYAVKATNMDSQEVNKYLSLIKISDEAFEKLVKYFENQEEKVIICMFGDHQPYIDTVINKADKTDANAQGEQIMNMYKTPFVIWANYDIEEAQGYDISMNYLGGLLLRTAGIPLSPYFCYLEQLRQEYPIITINGYVDSQGNYRNWESGQAEFPEYRMMQYNYLFDKKSVKWAY